MTTAGNTPNFVAANQVLPFRVVKIQDGNPFSVVHAGTGDVNDAVIGVIDGSVRSFRSNVHADPGEPVVLQNSEFVQVVCDPSVQIASGDLLSIGTNGTVFKVGIDTAQGANRAYFVACENAEYGEILWAKRVGSYETRPVQGDLLFNPEYVQTTDATPTTMSMVGALNNRATGLGYALANTAFGFSAVVTGSTATGGTSGSYLFQGLIRGPGIGTVTGANPMVIVASTKTVLGETNAALNCNLIIEASGGNASFECVGLAATTMRWTYSATVSMMGSVTGTF